MWMSQSIFEHREAARAKSHAHRSAARHSRTCTLLGGYFVSLAHRRSHAGPKIVGVAILAPVDAWSGPDQQRALTCSVKRAAVGIRSASLRSRSSSAF
jgi:hypothetical protein